MEEDLLDTLLAVASERVVDWTDDDEEEEMNLAPVILVTDHQFESIEPGVSSHSTSFC